ncbi:MAG TPA: hypothetical protein VMU40_02495 [Steroidobacteraceae bacterium]|nr:hypothetical protein [Steroidobacteraceae bacterium]
MRGTIGGTLDYAALAALNRPRTREEMRVAVHELAARGMTDYAIAHATDLAVEQVRRMLAERDHDTGERR